MAPTTVLVVEDESLIRMSAVEMVMAAGFEAIEASNADDAIRILEARSDIHLVFTDIQMPGTMDGIKLARYVRDRWPPVRIIVVSGDPGVEPHDLPHGALFFPKPYREGAVAGAMINMLSDIG
jgi:CheY-like chemotaxis protein